MEPIISPWWFYIIHVCNVLSVTAFSILVLSIFCILMLGILWVVSEGEIKDVGKNIKKFVYAIMASAVIVATVPDERTAYMMLAASVVTPANVTAAQDNIVEFVAKVADALRKKGDT